MARILSGVLAAAVWGAVVVAARAQAPADKQTTAFEARDLFEEGLRALDQGRPASAREAFERSLELVPRASTAFNLAVALRRSGEMRRALTALEELVSGAYGTVDPNRASQVKTLMREVQRELPRMEVIVYGAPLATVRVDGEARGQVREGTPLSLTLDPGRRLIAANAPGRVSQEREIQIRRGEQRELELRLSASLGDLPAEEAEALEDPEPRELDEGSEISIWWWVAGGAAIVVAGGALAAIALSGGGREKDPVFGDAATLRF